MVRVGGGWETLEEFLQKNDPRKGELFTFEIALPLSMLVLFVFYDFVVEISLERRHGVWRGRENFWQPCQYFL